MSTAQTAEARTPLRKRLLKWSLHVFVVLVLGVGVLAVVFYFEIHRANGQVLTGGRRRAYLLHVPKTYQSK